MHGRPGPRLPRRCGFRQGPHPNRIRSRKAGDERRDRLQCPAGFAKRGGIQKRLGSTKTGPSGPLPPISTEPGCSIHSDFADAGRAVFGTPKPGHWPPHRCFGPGRRPIFCPSLPGGPGDLCRDLVVCGRAPAAGLGDMGFAWHRLGRSPGSRRDFSGIGRLYVG